MRPSPPYLPPAGASSLTPGASSLTLCLDLDETLCHCVVSELEESLADESVAASHSLSFMEAHGPEGVRSAASHHESHKRRNARPQRPADCHVQLPYLSQPMGLFKRPHLDDFLHEAKRLGAELVLYTSAAEAYATACAEVLDPDRSLFSAILTREHCTLADSLYMKDLGNLGRPLERVVCVDDHVGACMLQPDNAVPVRPYTGEEQDHELPHVLSVLQRLKAADDVRDPLRRMYNLQATLLSHVRELKEARGQ